MGFVSCFLLKMFVRNPEISLGVLKELVLGAQMKRSPTTIIALQKQNWMNMDEASSDLMKFSWLELKTSIDFNRRMKSLFSPTHALPCLPEC